MTVTLKLPPEIESRVHEEAAKNSLPIEDYLVSLVTSAIPVEKESERRARALAEIDSLGEIGSEEEQRETFGFLARTIDEDRTSDRKLFQ